MYKKRKLEITPNTSTRNELAAEIPSVNKIVKRIINKDNVKNIYIKSDPKGRDFKDYMLSLRQLTDMFCPKFSNTWKYYGLNFAGGHYGDSQYGTQITTPVSAGAGTATDVLNCAIDDYQTKRAGWCDTIAWEAGSQAWFEHIMLPATWNTPTVSNEGVIRCQPSMSGIIDQTRNTITANMFNTGLQTTGSTAFANKRADYPIHYNGGFQSHTFLNNESFKVHFECYELTPRDYLEWFFARTKVAGGNTRVYSKCVADTVAADYNTVRQPFIASIAAAFNTGNYVVPSSIDDVNANNVDDIAHQNEAGQLIANKNDLGFKIRPWCSNTLKLFRVSKPHRGTIEPGGKFVYTMKVKPFVLMDSTWRKILRDFADDANHSGDDPYENPYLVHLVPKFSKILVVRFWSDLGNDTQITNGFETKDTEQNPHQYNNVSTMPGRLIHTVAEHHTARACLPTYPNSQSFKDFTKILYDQSVTDQGKWEGINDETDQSTQI